MENEQQKKRPRPMFEIAIPISGCLIRAAIWCHENDDGSARFVVSFSRTYRKSDDSWAYSDSFRRDDLLAISKASLEAHSWILANTVKEKTPVEEGDKNV